VLIVQGSGAAGALFLEVDGAKEDAVNRFKIRSPFTIHETVDGEVVMVNLETGTYYSLVGTGAWIWAAVERAATVEEIVADLDASFEGAGDQLEDTVRRFLDELAQEGLIVPSDDENGSVADARAVVTGTRESFTPPTLERFTDMRHLILLDPVHEVEEEKGWPHAKSNP
jgi:hypothetical protein